MTTYRAALCGLGNIAWLFDRNHLGGGRPCLSHAGTYQSQDKTTLAAGFSPDEEARKSFQQTFNLPVYESLEELLAREHPDIVSICSPSQAHYQQVLHCLEQGVPMIWLEKPPTLTLSEMETLLSLASESQSTVLVNYQRRFLPIYQEFKRRFRNRSLGRCRQLQAIYSRGLETNGSHILDLLFYVVDDNADFRLHWVSSADPVNPSFFLTIGEVEVVVSGADLPYHNIDITITCEEGRLSVLHGGMTGVFEKKIEHELFPGFYRLERQDDHTFSGLAGLAGGMENALQDLIDAHEQQRSPASSLYSASRSMALLQEVRLWQAGRSGL